MNKSASSLLFEKKEVNKTIRKTRKEGKVAREVQIFPGEMLENVNRINRTFTILKLPHKGKKGKARPWGLADTISYIVDWGAAELVQSPEFQRLEREAEELYRADKRQSVILDDIMSK